MLEETTPCPSDDWKYAGDGGEGQRERVRALRKLDRMGPRPPVVGLTFGEKWAVLSVSIIGKKEGIGTLKTGLQI